MINHEDLSIFREPGSDRGYACRPLQNSATLVRAVRRTADETLRPLEQQIEQQRRGQANENDRRFQTAAE